MQERAVFYFTTSIIAIVLIVLIYSRFFGAQPLVESTKQNLTPATSINLADENVEVKVRPLEDGYLYEITSEPELKIDSDSEEDVFAIISIKDLDAKAKVIGSSGDDYKFRVKNGVERYKFYAEITSYIPPLADWRFQLLDNGIPVIVKSNTQAPLILTARTQEVLDVASGIDTGIRECKADFVAQCDNDLKISRYLSFCDDSEKGCVRNQIMEVCGGTLEIYTVDHPDCDAGKISPNIFYKDGRQWDVGEMVEISFWRDNECTQKSNNFKELLILCPKDRLGGVFQMNAGIITP